MLHRRLRFRGQLVLPAELQLQAVLLRQLVEEPLEGARDALGQRGGQPVGLHGGEVGLHGARTPQSHGEPSNKLATHRNRSQLARITSVVNRGKSNLPPVRLTLKARLWIGYEKKCENWLSS